MLSIINEYLGDCTIKDEIEVRSTALYNYK